MLVFVVICVLGVLCGVVGSGYGWGGGELGWTGVRGWGGGEGRYYVPLRHSIQHLCRDIFPHNTLCDITTFHWCWGVALGLFRSLNSMPNQSCLTLATRRHQQIQQSKPHQQSASRRAKAVRMNELICFVVDIGGRKTQKTLATLATYDDWCWIKQFGIETIEEHNFCSILKAFMLLYLGKARRHSITFNKMNILNHILHVLDMLLLYAVFCNALMWRVD